MSLPDFSTLPLTETVERDTGVLLERLQLHGRMPEPLRIAHMIAGGVTTGESRHRA